ncbi:ABC transporter permease [Jiangella asiatica]|uniref:ABC transporter permease n=1 Tax=Jiangella asiatica TaxID=2530372 RepID=A0A4R5CPI3_9ACTN|nr:ABC transporter permease [Jiangella asiatica]TDE00691.1 ABC transporter permease [Jiangella asiatica]
MSRAATPLWSVARRRRWPLLAASAVLLGAWEIYGQARDSIILPPPSKVAAAFGDLVVSGQLLEAAVPSLQLLAAGLGASVLVGVAVGFLVARVPLADRLLGPYISALYATPEVALIPILIVWFGYGFSGRFVIVLLAGVFPMIYNVRAGVLAAPPDLEDMARSFDARRSTVVLRVLLPSAAPYIVVGLRQSIGRCVVGMILAEAFLRLGGLGGLVFTFGARFATDYLMASVLVLPVLGVALTRLVDVIYLRLSPWRRA